MPRWEPNAQERLVAAAVELYATQGYDVTTIGEIAASAGVTSRTYFRYFPDKREVLFGGAARISGQLSTSLGDAPADLAPWPAALHAVTSCDHLFDRSVHQDLRRREAVVASAPELQEREAHKLATLASVISTGLVERGDDPDHASLVADLAVVVFAHASRLWMLDPTTTFAAAVDRAVAQVRDSVR